MPQCFVGCIINDYCGTGLCERQMYFKNYIFFSHELKVLYVLYTAGFVDFI